MLGGPVDAVLEVVFVAFIVVGGFLVGLFEFGLVGVVVAGGEACQLGVLMEVVGVYRRKEMRKR